jgi:hypothetical protein
MRCTCAGTTSSPTTTVLGLDGHPRPLLAGKQTAEVSAAEVSAAEVSAAEVSAAEVSAGADGFTR